MRSTRFSAFVFDGRPPKDDGRTIVFLETIDGVAILGMRGLARLDMEPSRQTG
jgi:hypothetical protein